MSANCAGGSVIGKVTAFSDGGAGRSKMAN